MLLLRCPGQFYESRSEKFSSFWNRTLKGIECRPYSFFLLFGQVLIAFVFFRIVGSVTSLRKKKQINRGPKLNASISTWTAPCTKIKSEFVKLMGAWPIWCKTCALLCIAASLKLQSSLLFGSYGTRAVALCSSFRDGHRQCICVCVLVMFLPIYEIGTSTWCREV